MDTIIKLYFRNCDPWNSPVHISAKEKKCLISVSCFIKKLRGCKISFFLRNKIFLYILYSSPPLKIVVGNITQSTYKKYTVIGDFFLVCCNREQIQSYGKKILQRLMFYITTPNRLHLFSEITLKIYRYFPRLIILVNSLEGEVWIFSTAFGLGMIIF